MPFLDSNLVFCEEEAITGDNVIGDVLNLEEHGAEDAQLGYVYLNIQVDKSGTDDKAFELALRTSEDDGLATNEEVVVGITTDNPAVQGQHWSKGDVFSWQVPTSKMDKYVGLYCKTPSTDPANLEISAWLGMEPIAPLKIQKEP